MTLRYPAARWDPLGSQTEPPMRAHDVLCFHTMVGSLAGTSSMFHQNGYGGTESHFGVGETAAQGIAQWQDLMHEADANLEGHARVVSIETADYGGGFGTWNTNSDTNVPAWTAAQLNMLVDLTVWFCRKQTHAGCPASWKCHQSGVPCVLIPDTKPGRRGIGYHKQGCDPWRVDGGEKWSLAYGKGCPGQRRISQLINIVIPRAQRILAGATDQEAPMSAAEVQDLKNYIELNNQKYAVAVNNYVRQVLSTATKAILTEIDEVDEETAAQVETRLLDDFQKLSDQILADVPPPPAPATEA